MARAARTITDIRMPDSAAGPISSATRRPADRAASWGRVVRERIVRSTMVRGEFAGRTRGPYRDSPAQPILPTRYSRRPATRHASDPRFRNRKYRLRRIRLVSVTRYRSTCMTGQAAPCTSQEPASTKRPVTVIVFADIDDTFLAQRHAETAPDAEDVLASQRVAVVLCSSMTRAELEIVQQGLRIKQPFICESGAAILIPDGYFPFEVLCDRNLPGYRVISFGRPYAEVVAVLHRVAARLDTPIVGFSDQSIDQVAKECGLSLSWARLAKLREYDEPFRLVDPTREAHDRLWRALRSAGLGCTSRGLREHVGAPVDKGTTIKPLIRLFRRAFGKIVTAGVGTAPFSAPLLHRVHAPFVIGTPAGSSPWSLPDIARIQVSPDRTSWLETIVEVANRARHGRGAGSIVLQ
jgi:mannosyl-3-phosphoglycerate phosphatase